MKGLDIVGIALIVFSILIVLAFGAPRPDPVLGGYSIKDLMPVLPAFAGILMVVVARLKK